MLPKVVREDVRSQNIFEPIGINGTNQVVRMLLTTPQDSTPGESLARLMSSKRGRRPISTKSPNLATIPLEPSLLSSPSVNFLQSRQDKKFTPYSAQSYSKATPNFHLKAGTNGFRARAQSHKLIASEKSSAKGSTTPVKTSIKTASSVPKTAKQKVPSSPRSSMKVVASSAFSHENINEEKAHKAAAAGMQLVGGMVLMGNGKPEVAISGNGVSGAVSSLTKDRVQVCRTKEEKDKNPDSIRLDKRGVRVFPDIGGGESVTLKLLSLQHNLITRLENVPLLSQLVVLDLYDNRVERISGLQGLPSLRVLLLGKNRLKRIEGLDCLKRLEILDLHGNQLRYVDNLGGLTALRVLNLAGNLLRNIRNLGPYGMSSLTELNLKRNRIRNLDGLQKAPHLKKLLLANNDIQNMASLGPLRKLLFLNELVVDPNPVITQVGGEYHSQILTLFPNLNSLDRNPVSDEMKQAAKLWHKKKLEEDERRRLEEEKIRFEIAQSVGPPGSREQVIFQARQRWESLKKFVKSGPTNETSPPPKKPIKSMRKAVSAAVAVHAKRKAESLYPPATLDLEEFPDGHLKFEQTESIMGSKNYKAKEKDEQSQLDLAKEVTNNIKPREDALVTVHTEKVDDTKEPKPDLTQFPENSATEKELVPIPEFRMNVSPCPSSGSSRSAKVAVVRPLIHEPSLPLDPSNETPKENLHHKEEQTSSSSLTDVHNNQTEENKKPSDTEPQTSTSELFKRVSVEEKQFTKENGPMERSAKKMEIIREVSYDQDCNLASQPNESNPVPTPIPKVLMEDSSVQTQPTRVKSKLLKHLRSISLDSYSHPFLRPDVTKREDVVESPSRNSASPIVASDDDCGEEEDDNDDEVQDYDEDDCFSIATSTGTTVTSGSTPRRSSTVTATTNRLLRCGPVRKQQFPRTRSQRLKIKDRTAKLFTPTSELSPRSSNVPTGKRIGSGTGVRGDLGSAVKPPPSARVLRRCDSAASLSSTLTGSNSNLGSSGALISGSKSASNGHLAGDATDLNGPNPYRKQGVDFLVEIEGKLLNIFGQGGLRHALTAFASNVTCHVNTAKFHYISYDSIIPFFGKLRQVYPSLEHFHFRANNLCTLSQLDALSDLQGLTSLSIAKEGNPIVRNDSWTNYASYRLSHWGLQIINGIEISSDYRSSAGPSTQVKGFESLGFLALSCLPQAALTPLAKRLHMLHCFCCCSPSTSSEESNRRLPNNRITPGPSQQATGDHTSSNFCTAWDDDPVLLDVIGKEALVYCPPLLPPDIFETIESSGLPSNSVIPPQQASSPSPFEKKRADTLSQLIDSGVTIVEKIDMLEKVWPSLMTQVIQEMLMDYRFMDSYMKKELKKSVDITLINQQHAQNSHHTKKHRF